MKINKIYTKPLLLIGMVVSSCLLTSCEDFLTILPTNQIPEENFWQDKADLDGVVAGAYEKLAQESQTSRILVWGEIRSDNLTQNDMTQTFITSIQEAVLQPTNSIFDWSGFYTGINYCNQVLEKGYSMTTPGEEVDPSFTRTDFRTIAAEMYALRSLYYFYLVRAFRDVPYETSAYYSDDEATTRGYLAASPGVAILGVCIDTLESQLKYAVNDYGNSADNKGRFTKLSVQALLADMYLWRACMLKNYVSKLERYPHGTYSNDGRINMSDIAEVGADSVTVTYKTEDGTIITDAYCNELSTECLNKCITYATNVINGIREDYDEYLDRMGNAATSEEKSQPYPLYLNQSKGSNVSDEVYSYNFGSSMNSRESVLELQYDGSTTINSTITTYLSSNQSSFGAKYMGISNTLIGTATTVDPEVGFGQTDFRLLETCYYASTDARKPVHKFLLRQLNIGNYQDLTDEDASNTFDYRDYSSIDAHWPIYRLTDMMLIKAEAIARTGTTDSETLREGYRLVNQIFKRNNPALVDDRSETTDDKFVSTRVSDTYGEASETDHTFSKTAADLLPLVYRERQREYVGEGKRWFDIVRLAEAAYDPTDSKSIKTAVGNYISLTTSVMNRLTNLWSYYCPIYSDEMNINGIDNGGKLEQNPVWDRYSKK